MKNSSTPKCWICGSEADSGEHRTKKSDLGLAFPYVSADSPIYTKNEYGKFIKIHSLDSDRFKSRAPMCSHCNTTRTQPFDKAWETLSNYLHSNTARLRNSSQLQLHKIFPGKTRESMLFVHLFFVKIFGCLISEHNILIDIEPFRSAILKQSEHPQIYIGIGFLQQRRDKNIVQISPIESVTNNIEKRLHFCSWQYFVNEAFVDISFSVKAEYTSILRNVWQPSKITKCQKFTIFRPIQNLDFNHIFK